MGQLIGIARRSGPRVPMETLARGDITTAGGLVGDFRGAKFKSRQITILAMEDWEAALLELSDLMGPPELAWTTRRANLLVEGVRLPRAAASVLRVGGVVLEVTGQTYPCARMEAAHKGLLSALAPNWRGGVTCRVCVGGMVSLGDVVEIIDAKKEHVARLPG